MNYLMMTKDTGWERVEMNIEDKYQGHSGAVEDP